MVVFSLRLAGVEKAMQLKVPLLHLGQGKLLAPSIDKNTDKTKVQTRAETKSKTKTNTKTHTNKVPCIGCL